MRSIRLFCCSFHLDPIGCPFFIGSNDVLMPKTLDFVIRPMCFCGNAVTLYTFPNYLSIDLFPFTQITFSTCRSGCLSRYYLTQCVFFFFSYWSVSLLSTEYLWSRFSLVYLSLSLHIHRNGMLFFEDKKCTYSLNCALIAHSEW